MSKPKTYVDAVCIILIISLFIYSILRALKLSITCDEAWSYLTYSKQSLWEIIYWPGPAAANNHILNTLLMKISYSLFGLSEFSLRLPNVVAHLVFAVFSYKLLKNFIQKPIFVFTGFILLNFNPYLIDYFSLARGYGLASAFLIVSLFCFFTFIKERKNRFLWQSFIFGGLAVWCNFTFLNYYLALGSVHGLFTVQQYFAEKNMNRFSQNIIPPAIISGLLGLIIYRPISLLRKHNELYIGGDNGFWSDTVLSLIRHYLYGGHPFKDHFLNIIPPIILFFSVISLFYFSFIFISQISQKKLDLLTPFNTLFLVLLFMILSVIAQYYLLDNLFVKGRGAISFYPVFFFLLTFTLYNLSLYKRLLPWVSILLAFPIVIGTIVLMIHSTNLRSTYDFYYDAHAKEMLSTIKKINEPIRKIKKPISIGIEYASAPAIEFYTHLWKADWIAQPSRHGFMGDFDYYYIYFSNEEMLNNNNIELNKIACYKNGFCLFQQKK